MTKEQNRRLHSLLNELGLMEQKGALVAGITNSRTESSRDLSTAEATKLIGQLGNMRNDQLKPMRGKVVHLLCLMGYVGPDGGPDVQRIDWYLRGIGTRNPKRQGLYQMNKKTLRDVLNQIDQRYKKEA